MTFWFEDRVSQNFVKNRIHIVSTTEKIKKFDHKNLENPQCTIPLPMIYYLMRNLVIKSPCKVNLRILTNNNEIKRIWIIKYHNWISDFDSLQLFWTLMRWSTTLLFSSPWLFSSSSMCMYLFFSIDSSICNQQSSFEYYLMITRHYLK